MRMFESEQYLEVWALSIHFYEQTLINKGFLSLKKLMIARKIAKKSKYVKQEIVQKRLIRNAFKVWREKFTNISQRRGKVFKSLNHWGMKMQKVVINKLKHKVIQSKHKRLVVLDKYLETRATVFIALMLKSPQIMQKWNAKTDLEQVVNQSILRRYKDFSPFIAQSIKKYYMSKVFNELFQHKKKAIQQGLQQERTQKNHSTLEKSNQNQKFQDPYYSFSTSIFKQFLSSNKATVLSQVKLLNKYITVGNLLLFITGDRDCQ
eukprot:403348493